MHFDQLRQELAQHAARCPEQAAEVETFLALLSDPEDPFKRERLAGHFTGSAWLVDDSGTSVLLTHHRKLDRWLQLGGHADGDAVLSRVALREAEEESGLTGLRVQPGIFDLDRHLIPARGTEPAHWHYDVRYVVRTSGNEDFVVNEESHALAWRDIRGIAADPGSDESLRRMARRWLEQSVP